MACLQSKQEVLLGQVAGQEVIGQKLKELGVGAEGAAQDAHVVVRVCSGYPHQVAALAEVVPQRQLLFGSVDHAGEGRAGRQKEEG